MNTFDRTIILCKEKMADGKIRIRRIPWDLISFGNSGFFAAPMPVRANWDARVSSATSNAYVADIDDMLIEDNPDKEVIDEIVDILYFDSEEDFNARFQGAFGYYKLDASGEFGFPRS